MEQPQGVDFVDTLGLSHLRDSPFIDSLLFLFKESLDLF